MGYLLNINLRKASPEKLMHRRCLEICVEVSEALEIDREWASLAELSI